MSRPESNSGLVPPTFAIVRTDLDSTVSLSVSGELDALTAPKLEDAIMDAKTGRSRLVLDLTELRFIDSMGLSVLLSAKKLSHEDGFQLFVIPSEHDEVTRVFALTDARHSLN
jgi:anti-anti-sigma factor